METNDQQHVEPQIDSIADYHDDVRQIELEGYALGVKKARNALFFTAGLIFLGEMIAMFTSFHEFNAYIFAFALIEAAIFVALALWTRKKPYTAVVTGLIAFIGIILLAAAAGAYESGAGGFFKTLVGGFIIKIIIIVNLVRALQDSKALQEALEEQQRNV